MGIITVDWIQSVGSSWKVLARREAGSIEQGTPRSMEIGEHLRESGLVILDGPRATKRATGCPDSVSWGWRQAVCWMRPPEAGNRAAAGQSQMGGGSIAAVDGEINTSLGSVHHLSRAGEVCGRQWIGRKDQNFDAWAGRVIGT
jgi:hypothetical protein